MPLVEMGGGGRRRRPFDDLELPGAPPAEPTVSAPTTTTFPNGPWNDWPMPGTPTPSTPTYPRAPWQDFPQGEQGYKPAPQTPAPVTPTARSGDYTGFGNLWMGSGGRTPQDLAAFIAAHPEYGATAGGSKGDKVTLGGRTYDAVIAAGLGGQGASWSDITTPTTPTYGSGFIDPGTQQYEDILSRRLNELFNPLISQQRAGLEKVLGQQRDASKPDLDALLDFARQRFQSLQGPALTPQEQELMKTAISDPLSAAQSAMKQRATERTAAKGYAPTSGLAELDTRDIERSIASEEAQGNRALALDWLNRGEQRQGQALEIGGLIPRLQSEDLAERAAAAGQLLSIEQAFQQSEESRRNYGTQLAQELAALPERRLMLASQINSGGNQQLPQLFQSLLSLAGMGQQNQQANQQRTQNWLLGLGQILGGLFG